MKKGQAVGLYLLFGIVVFAILWFGGLGTVLTSLLGFSLNFNNIDGPIAFVIDNIGVFVILFILLVIIIAGSSQ